MTVSARFSLVFTLGLSLLTAAATTAAEPLVSEPPRPISFSNQQMAENIAARLRQSGQLQHYDVNVRFHEEVAELTGSVADVEQRDRVLRLVQDVAGVRGVVDRLSVAGAIVPVQAGGIPEVLPPVQGANTAPPPLAAPSLPPATAGPAAPAASGAPPSEAMPIFQAPAPTPNQLNPPRMPPYAWPTYAPYNNYSRVGYPLAYPCNAFPFIGPVYPFPKVPLGWRSVRLEWDDGFWWFSKTATRWDWWKLRYY
ncbi:MAG TPA: BON domain-containing protein [Gemmataceae bacterium]|nr:BON domain-containing protein [Gemmataceae bacterium]